MAAQAKQQGTSSSVMCDSFIKTRRLNQTESFLLEGRLKVLDCKKSQKNAEYRVEKYSLQKQIEEIRNVRSNPGISVERRKLLRSQGYTIDARTALGSSEDMPAAYKRFSMPDMSGRDSPGRRSPKVLSLHKSEPIMKAFSQLTIQGGGETEKGGTVTGEQQSDPDGTTRTRARHQFRVIEPPCRPGSRRNFVQLSNEKLKELKEKEDKESKETLFDPNLKLDHRGVILSPRLVKSLRDTSQAEIMKSDETAAIEPRISNSVDNQSKEATATHQKQIYFTPDCAEIFEDEIADELKSRFLTADRKLISKSCESLDSITEVRAPDVDSSSDCHDNVSISRDTTASRRPDADHKSITDKAVSQARKHASTRPPVRLAFVESPDPTPDMNKRSCFGSEIELRQPRVQNMHYSHNVSNTEINPSHSGIRNFTDTASTENTQSSREKSAEGQRKRRATLPPGKFNAVSSQIDIAPNHDGSKREPKSRLSVASLCTNVRKSKKSVFSMQPERKSRGGAVTYAYDARPNRSLCKGYVTMQMTVKGKQVKVHIPKFPNDTESEPILDRIRKKVSIQTRFQPRTLQEKVKSNEEETSQD